jgi:hypothetical protein
MEQGDTALPLIEAKSAARPMGGSPAKTRQPKSIDGLRLPGAGFI